MLCLLLLQSPMLFAQEIDDLNKDELNKDKQKLHVLITDGQIEKNIAEVDTEITSSAYSVIPAQRLRGSFVSLTEVLEQEVGVQMRATGGEGSLSTIVLRGASSEQVIIYLDGVPLNDASGGPVDLSIIPVNTIERIEIYRGSTPLELGSPSIGGAVNIITRKSSVVPSENPAEQDEKNSQLSASVASFQTYKLNATSLVSSERDDVLLNASYLQSENDYSFVNDNGTQFNPADDRREKRNNDAVKHLAILSNWKHRIDKQYDTEIRLEFLDREKGIPSVTNNADVQTSIDTRIYNLLAQFNAKAVGSKNIDINTKLFATRKEEVFDDSLAQIGFFNQRKESVTAKSGAQLLALLKQQQTQWKLLTAASRETYEAESTRALVQSGKNTRNQLEVSAGNVAYFDDYRLIINSVLRYQKILDELSSQKNRFGNIAPAFDKTYDLLNPQLGAKYRFSKRTYATANIGTYDRAPSFFEIFGGDGLLLGNPDLKQETSLNTDAGVTYTWFKPYDWLHNTELYAGVFYNQIDNLIVRIYNGQGIGVPKNISSAVIRGFESTVKIKPSVRHSISANVSLIDSINNSGVAVFNGKVLPGYYQQSFSFRYAYSLDRWLYSVEADIKRNMYYDRGNLLKGDDVNLINLALRRYFQHSNIDFRVNNILDENIQYFRNRPTPGLSISLTYNHSF